MALANLAGIAVLVIGESHMSLPSYLLDPLTESLTNQGAKVYAYGACGASAGDWLKKIQVPCGAKKVGSEKATVKGSDATTTPIKDLISFDKPDIVLVIIGDTMASYGKPFPQAWAWQGVTSLAKEISSTNTPCIWVGPAWGKEGGKYGKNNDRVKFFSTFLANNVSPCEYVESTKFSNIGDWATIDGQHLTPAGYKSWSSKITQSVLNSPLTKPKKI
jgi:hypothetical protein